ncbi:MAG: aminotransferase class V-fold PLP-dependent enzyme [Williamsia sp.]|nr:aminotransferase class V-fold PLP-dependent enzyme [Williamsia sp.]
MREGTNLQDYFEAYQRNIIGHNLTFETPFGTKELVYADWTASGRAYKPIEDCLQQDVMPFLGNTHTGTTVTGRLMSEAYEEAKQIIKRHVHACEDDVLLFCGSGMTGAVNKLQRILGLRVPERLKDYLVAGNDICIDEALRPVVFITHMEHHSNQVSWLETIADVEMIRPCKDGYVNLEHFGTLLERFRHRKNKIAAVTACSNVTGIETPYHEIAKLIHQYKGSCFVDFASSAPYINIDMHPREAGAHLDAIYFSPHKFLGGPGTPGILIFARQLYNLTIPDQPGGGTVVYSNPWKTRDYVAGIELREDGGTPPILQGIKAAMCVRLKEALGADKMRKREEELLQAAFDRFETMKNVEVLAGHVKKRLSIVSFVVKGAHYPLIVQLLNDRFGIQLRGGCACAGTYGHELLKIEPARSYKIREALRSGDPASKPGWIRLSLHPTMTSAEIQRIMDAIDLTASCFKHWAKDYTYSPASNEYVFNGKTKKKQNKIEKWFNSIY